MQHRSVFENLAEIYGLKLIMEQNDLDEVDVIATLFYRGEIDIEDYLFKDMEITDED